MQAELDDLVEQARGGDERAFGELIARYRGELHAHCYRMLGSVDDADDALQEATIRAWRGIKRFEGRSSLRSWLYTIATNACLTLLDRRPKRVLPLELEAPTNPREAFLEPPVETVWIEPYPDQEIGIEDGWAGPDARYEQREGVELAFVAALQQLPANQRAVLILREVLGYSAREVADVMETTVQSVNSALQRARKTMEERGPERTQQQTLRALGDRKLTIVVERYMNLMSRGDVDGMVGMLAADAAWSMPPARAWFAGHEQLRGFLLRGPLSGEWRWRHVPTHANGQPAIGSYVWTEPEDAFVAFALDVLTLTGEQLAAVTSFIVRSTAGTTPEYYERWCDKPLDHAAFERCFGRFGLPERLD